MNSRSTNTPSTPAALERRSVAGSLLAAATLAVALAIPSSPIQAAAVVSPAPATTERDGFADLVEQVQPAVVNVSTTSKVKKASANSMPFRLPEGSPFAEQFREYFGRRGPGAPGGDAPDAHGVGSGFLIDAQGHVVTNNHVIDGADAIQVTLSDGTELEATVVGHDEKTDLAVLKVNSDKPLPFVDFGDSDVARVGDWVVAVGSPFGLGGTVTAGIISARGRDIRSGPFDDYLQVDAPINRGNSGGPLFDRSGKVVGVNTAIFSPSGGNVGIGFAIPSKLAREVVTALRTEGRVQRGWMGVSIQGLTPELAESFGLEDTHGALVGAVVPDSPAEKAGVAVGDVIVAFDGTSIESTRDLPRVVASTKAGSSVAVKVIRDGKPQDVTLNVGRMPGEDQLAAGTDELPTDEARLGVELADLDDEARTRLGLSADVDGVLVADVQAGSPAARQGLRAGDIILRVGKEKVSQPGQVAKAVRDAHGSNRPSVVMLVSRNGNERFVAVPFTQG
jgi:serine protease Do